MINSINHCTQQVHEIHVYLVGASSRARSVYIPLLKELKQECNITIEMCYNRTLAKAKQLVECLQEGAATDDLDEINAVAKNINLAIISVDSKLNYKFAKKLLSGGFNVFIDTPISRKIHEAISLQEIAENNKKYITAGEDKAFSTSANRAAWHFIETHRECAIKNMCYASSYHGFALARRIMDSHKSLKIKSFKGEIRKEFFTTRSTEYYEFYGGLKLIWQNYAPNRHPIRHFSYLIAETNLGMEILSFSRPNKPEECDLIASSSINQDKREGLYRNLKSFIHCIVMQDKSLMIYNTENSIEDLLFSKAQMLSRRFNYKLHMNFALLCAKIGSRLKIL